MEEKLKSIEGEALSAIKSCQDTDTLEKLRIKYLGRKGEITKILRSISNLSPERRPTLGKRANELKQKIQEALLAKTSSLQEIEEKVPARESDITLPGQKYKLGTRHPITQVLEQIERTFIRMGFQVVECPEVETEYYNFDALNTSKDHPARDEHDSFYIADGVLLRTHTSPVQIRVMEKRKPPLRIISSGKCYRRDPLDASHTPMFHQVDGFLVDKLVTFADLKGVLETFLHQMFGPEAKTRFRPAFFPFTEPSAEVSISCIMCGGAGCKSCGHSGWIEILGAGMIDPEVFKAVNYDYEEYSGFAFGMGVERIAMLKYGIEDIRLFYENDIRFLNQF